MKKFFAIITIIGFLVPSHFVLGQGTPTPTDEPSNGNILGELLGTQSAASGVVCGTAQQQGILQSILGGALGQIFEGIGGGGSVAGGIIDLLGGSSGIEGILNNPELFGNLGDALGGVNLGNLGDLGSLGSVFDDIDLGGIFGGGGGGITGIAGNIPGLSSIPGVSILGGGGAVPVNADALNKIQEAAYGVATETKNIGTEALRKECVADPMVTQLNRRALDQAIAQIVGYLNEGRGGESFRVSNRGQLLDLAGTNAIRSLIDDVSGAPIQGGIKSSIVGWLTNTYGGQTGTASRGDRLATLLQDIGEPAATGDPVDDFLTVMLCGGGNVACMQFATMDAARAEQEAARQEVLRATQEGYFPQGVCLDKEGNPIEGMDRIEDCPTSFQVTVPETNIKAAGIRADEAGEKQLSESDEVGETVGLISGLFQQALGSLFGFLDLSNNDSDGGGSYLDQVTGSSDTGSTDATRGYVLGSITDSLNAEAQYQATLGTMLSNLNTARGSFVNNYQCYATLAVSSFPGLPLDVINTRLNQASTTISVIIDPQIALRTAELNDSQAISAELQRLSTQGAQSSSATEVNAVSGAFEALSSSGLAHSTADVALLSQDLSGNASALQAAVAESEASLAECQNYTNTTTVPTI